MFTWLNRLMILVFVFNIMAPELVYAQRRPDIAPVYPTPNLPSDRITPEHYSPRVIGTASTPVRLRPLTPAEQAEINRSIEQSISDAQSQRAMTHDLLRLYNEAAVYPDDIDSQKQLADIIAHMHHFGVPNDYYGRGYWTSPDLFLERFSALEMNDIVDAMDPVAGDGSYIKAYTDSAILVTFYAASALLNEVNEIVNTNKKLDKEEQLGWDYLFPRIELRALHRLSILSTRPATAHVIMARSVLRTLVYQIYQAYNQNTNNQFVTFLPKRNTNDFARVCTLSEVTVTADRPEGTLETENQPESLPQDPVACEQMLAQTRRPNINVTVVDDRDGTAKDGDSIVAITSVNRYSFADGIQSPIQFWPRFRSEITALKNSDDCEPGDKDFANLILAIQFAANYAIQTNQASRLLEDLLLSIEGARKDNYQLKENEFNNPKQAPLFDALFDSIKAGLADPRVSQAAKNDLTNFLDFAARGTDSQGRNRSITARILALDTIGMISSDVIRKAFSFGVPDIEQFKNFYETLGKQRMAAAMNNQSTNVLGVNYAALVDKNNPFSTQQRNRYAAYVADIYQTLSNEAGFQYESYGLDSQQMAKLQDILARVIFSLSPLVVPEVVALGSGPNTKYHPVPYLSEEKRAARAARIEADDISGYPPTVSIDLNPLYAENDPRAHYQTHLDVFVPRPKNEQQISAAPADALPPGAKNTRLRRDPQSLMVEEVPIYVSSTRVPTPPFYVFNSAGTPVPIYPYNDPNKYKETAEAGLKIIEVIVDIATWIIGGVVITGVFKAIGTAAKLTIGAIRVHKAAKLAKAVEKANKTARTANKGRKFERTRKAAERIRKGKGKAELPAPKVETTIPRPAGGVVIVNPASAGEASGFAADAAAATATRTPNTVVEAVESIPHGDPKVLKAFGKKIAATEFDTPLARTTTEHLQVKMVNGTPQFSRVTLLEDGTVLSRETLESAGKLTRAQQRMVSSLAEGEESVLQTTSSTVYRNGRIIRSGQGGTLSTTQGAADETTKHLLEQGWKPVKGQGPRINTEGMYQIKDGEVLLYQEGESGVGAFVRSPETPVIFDAPQPVSYYIQSQAEGVQIITERIPVADLDEYILKTTVKLGENGRVVSNKPLSFAQHWRLDRQGRVYQNFAQNANNRFTFTEPLQGSLLDANGATLRGGITGSRGISIREFEIAMNDLYQAQGAAAMSQRAPLNLYQLLGLEGPTSDIVLDAAYMARGTATRSGLILGETQTGSAADAAYYMLRDPVFGPKYAKAFRFGRGDDMLGIGFKGLNWNVNMGNINEMSSNWLGTVLRDISQTSPNLIHQIMAKSYVMGTIGAYVGYTYVADPIIHHTWLMPMLQHQAEKQTKKAMAPYKADLEGNQNNGPQPPSILDQIAAAAKNPSYIQGANLIAPIYTVMLAFKGLDMVTDQDRLQLQTNVEQLRLQRAETWQAAKTQMSEKLAQLRTDCNNLRQQDIAHRYTQELDAIMRAIDNWEESFNRIDQTNTTPLQKVNAFNKWITQPNRELEEADRALGRKRELTLWQDMRQLYVDVAETTQDLTLKDAAEDVISKIDALSSTLDKILAGNTDPQTQARKINNLYNNPALVKAQTDYSHRYWTRTLENMRADYKKLFTDPKYESLNTEINAVLAELDKLPAQLDEIIHSKDKLPVQQRARELFNNPALMQAKNAFFVKYLPKKWAEDRASWQRLLEQPNSHAQELSNILSVLDNMENRLQQIINENSDPIQQSQQLAVLVNDAAYQNAVDAWTDKQIASNIQAKLEQLNIDAMPYIQVRFSPYANEVTQTWADEKLQEIEQHKQSLQKLAACKDIHVKQQLWELWNIVPALIEEHHPLITTMQGQAELTRYTTDRNTYLGSIYDYPTTNRVQQLWAASETQALFREVLRNLDNVWANDQLSVNEKQAHSNQIYKEYTETADSIYNAFRRAVKGTSQTPAPTSSDRE